jgi:uncharacterized protein (TIGR02117 family)
MRWTTASRISIIGTIAYLLVGCAWTPVAPYAGPAPRDQTIYLIAGAWHTEIGLSREAAAALPRRLTDDFPNARYLVFGWGERGYYTARDPGSGDLLRALAPGPSALLVIPLATSPEREFGSANVFRLAVSQQGIDSLSEYLWAYVAMDGNETPLRIAAGPEPGSIFYASSRSYSVTRTCNTWTAEALRVAGLPIQADGVIFAGQVLSQARPLAIGGALPP